MKNIENVEYTDYTDHLQKKFDEWEGSEKVKDWNDYFFTRTRTWKKSMNSNNLIIENDDNIRNYVRS